MALINTTTTGILGTTVYGDGAGALTVQRDGVTQGVYGNIPAFEAYSTSTTTTTNNTLTKVVFNAKNYDTANCYDTTNYRWTPNVAGYYQINWNLDLYSGGTNTMYFSQSYLLKNGSTSTSRRGTGLYVNTSYQYLENYSVGSTLIYMNGTTDYLEVYAQTVESDASSGQVAAFSGSQATYWNGFLAKAV